MRVGIVGGGQLGQMLALAAIPLGHDVLVLSDDPGGPASHIAHAIFGKYGDEKILAEFTAKIDVATCEFEHVPQEALQFIETRSPLRPGLRSMAIASDRWLEKEHFRSLGIPTSLFQKVDSVAELKAAIKHLGLPILLKTRRFGYDGKGQRLISNEKEIETAFFALGGEPLIAEQFVAFERELSMIGVRTMGGAIFTYPMVQNLHHEGILFCTIAPAPEVPTHIELEVREALCTLLESLDHVGVLTLELFQTKEGWLANEIAPRVHNSGHFSIEGATISQFEAHIRAITGDPLSQPMLRGVSVMVNLIGAVPPREDILAIDGVHLHLYGKSPRPGRKLGHVTICGESWEELLPRLEKLIALVESTQQITALTPPPSQPPFGGEG
ncbi:MAG: 5-(carboxyamino)imidazole ribonucleotide synthase [Sandaracinaceae bacterium]|nr:5-(carboxyamino)imidazole ribonucleotide synthase [Sandaracinaceae bacterium]